MTDMENIDGYVSKDSLYRLLSNYRRAHVLTEKEKSIVDDIIVAIKDMPNEKEKPTLEEMMYMYRDSIASRMMESIRKDCEEE